MIRRWLEKPWVSALLALAAVAVLYFNVWRPMHPSHPVRRVSGAMAGMPAPDSPPSPRPQDAAISAADWNRLGALAAQTPPRDPFLPPVAAVADAPGAPDAAVSHSHSFEPMPALHVGAIVRGADGEYAWIDDQLVRAGERVRGLQVVHIGENSVDLRRGGRKMRIFLDSSAGRGRRP